MSAPGSAPLHLLGLLLPTAAAPRRLPCRPRPAAFTAFGASSGLARPPTTSASRKPIELGATAAPRMGMPISLRFRTVVAKIQTDAAALSSLPNARRNPAKTALVIAAATLGSRVDKHNWRMKDESGDRKSLSLVEEYHAFPGVPAGPAQIDRVSLPHGVSEYANRLSHGQPPAALDDSDSDDEDDDGGDGDGDGGDGGVVETGS
ncbi:MAG: hypothetical protein M1816_002648 [Peltula sp. TS41687]|nr:MAG: hypothetical protein M1816_002648 [Peltula sp. TS41687]